LCATQGFVNEKGQSESQGDNQVAARYPFATMKTTLPGNSKTLSLDELRIRLRPFCERHHIRRLEIFGSVARGSARSASDVDLLATFDGAAPVSTAELLEMAGEAEEVVGRPVDFVLRASLENSPNRFARQQILSTAVLIYGS